MLVEGDSAPGGRRHSPDVGGPLGASAPPAPISAEVRPAAEGFLRLTREGVFDAYAQDLPELEKRVLFAVQGPTNGEVFSAAVSTPAWRSKKSWYLVAAEDRAIQPDLQRKMAKHLGATDAAAKSGRAALA